MSRNIRLVVELYVAVAIFTLGLSILLAGLTDSRLAHFRTLAYIFGFVLTLIAFSAFWANVHFLYREQKKEGMERGLVKKLERLRQYVANEPGPSQERGYESKKDNGIPVGGPTR